MRPHPWSLATLCLAFCVASALGWAEPVAAGNAYDQLVDVCHQSGGNCNPTVPSVPTPTRESRPSTGGTRSQPAPRTAPAPRAPTVQEQVATGIVGGLIQDLFSGLFSTEPTGPSPEELALQEQQRIAAIQARAAAVSQQRATRDAAQASNMDAMAASMSSGWDRPTGTAPGSGSAVALRGTTPALFAPPTNPLRPVPSAAAERLARMAAENQDVAVLTQRLTELTGQLEAAQREADLVGRSAAARVQEYEGMEQSVARGVADAQDRGMSMAFDGLFMANGKAIQALSEVQASGRAWHQMKDLLREAQGGLDLAHDAGEKLGQWSDDAAFAARQRDFKEDVTYLAKRLGGPYAELGGSILSSARTVREELAVLHRQGELNGFEKGYQERLSRVHREMDGLITQVKGVRVQLAQRTGIAEGDLALPPQHRGLGATVPSLAE